jgi:hypothetical protein
MKATALLEEQHRKAEALFSKLESGDTGVLAELANALVAHMTIEQEIFYPAVRSIDADRVTESFEEHAVAELALKRLLAADQNEETFPARVSVLQELVQNHIDEEESDLFPTVEAELSTEQLETLGEQMKWRFDEVLSEDDESKLPRGFDETSADRARGSTGRRAAGGDDEEEKVTQRAPQRRPPATAKPARKKSPRAPTRPAR